MRTTLFAIRRCCCCCCCCCCCMIFKRSKAIYPERILTKVLTRAIRASNITEICHNILSSRLITHLPSRGGTEQSSGAGFNRNRRRTVQYDRPSSSTLSDIKNQSLFIVAIRSVDLKANWPADRTNIESACQSRAGS